MGREGHPGVRERLEEEKDGSEWISYLCLSDKEEEVEGKGLGDRKEGKYIMMAEGKRPMI